MHTSVRWLHSQMVPRARLAFVMVALVTLAGCVGSSVADGSPLNLEMALEESSLVVVATVQEVGRDRWTTPTGFQPLLPYLAGAPRHDIFQPVTVQVEEVVLGQEGLPATSDPPFPLHIARLGGQVGATTRDYDLVHNSFEVGQRVLLFLKPFSLAHTPDLPQWESVAPFVVTDGIVDFYYESPPLDQVLQDLQDLRNGPEP